MKQQFIKSVMSVLRLEDNIYTVGAIELIIDKLKESDYQHFIAYLGERKGEYEKPIQALTNAVNEYYDLKLSPYKKQAEEKAEMLIDIFYNVDKRLVEKANEYSKSEDCISEATEYANENYGKQSEENIQNAKHNKIFNLRECKLKEYEDEFYNMDIESFRNHIVVQKTVYKNTDKRVFDEDSIKMIFSIGLNKFQGYGKPNSLIIDYLHTSKLKPSIKHQIVQKELEKIEDDKTLIDSKVKRLLIENKSEEIVL